MLVTFNYCFKNKVSFPFPFSLVVQVDEFTETCLKLFLFHGLLSQNPCNSSRHQSLRVQAKVGGVLNCQHNSL